MLKSIIFSDEITLWWDQEEFSKKTTKYKLYVDGGYYGETTKTHYTFDSLSEGQRYLLRIEAYIADIVVATNEYILYTKKAKNRLDVTKVPYCAVGDGKAVNTLALQKALDDCGENDCVYFPAGTYLTGALDVHSNCEIYLEKGAVLKGTEDIKDYLPKIKSRFEGIEMECYRSLLNLGKLDHKSGYNCHNVAIRGQGTIYGGGKPLALAILETEKERLKEYMEKNAEYVKTCENANTIPGRARGRLINMSNCENVIISGLTLGYGAAWNVHFVYSKNIITYNCNIQSNVVKDENGNIVMDRVWNGDGWDPDSSEDCVIFGTVFQTADDCIAIKSGKNPEGNIINRPTKNIYAFDCFAISGHGFSIGSEMSGGVENVRVWDSDFKNTPFGVQIKAPKERGGYVKNIYVSNCAVKRIDVSSAVGYNNDGISAQFPPVLSDYYYENVTCYGRGEQGDKRYVSISGFEDENYALKNVRFVGIRFVQAKGETIIRQQNVYNVEWQDIEYIH